MKDSVLPMKKRMANIELLRVLSMLMVITLHFLSRGGVSENAVPFSGIWFLDSVWDGLAIVSVNVYVLISGYFLIQSEFKPQKLINIILQVFTYSFLFYVIFTAIGKNTFSIAGFIKACFPVLTNQYWFASAYVGLYILFPFLNKGLRVMTQKQHRNLVIVLVLLFTLYLPSKALGQNGYSIVWMVCLYVFAAYLRLYYKPKKKITGKMVLFYIIPSVLLPLSRICITVLSKVVSPAIANYGGWFYKNNSVLVLWASVALFVLFLNLEIKGERSSKWICTAGSLTFGIYLFHNNPTLRDYLWQTLRLPEFMVHWWFFFAGVGIIIAIFIVSAVVEFFRKSVYDRIICSKAYTALYQKIAACRFVRYFQ